MRSVELWEETSDRVKVKDFRPGDVVSYYSADSLYLVLDVQSAKDIIVLELLSLFTARCYQECLDKDTTLRKLQT